MKKIKKEYRMPIILFISMIVGIILGFIVKDSSIFNPFKDIFLNAMYTIVVPLVFFSISSSIANMTNLSRLSKILKYTFIVFIVTSLVSSIFMLLGLSIFDISSNVILNAGNVESLDVPSKLVNMITVGDFSQLFSRSNMLPLIIASIIFGIATAKIKDNDVIVKPLSVLKDIMLYIVKIIMYYSPIGICAYFASIVSEYGPAILGSYAKCMIFYFVMCILYFLVFYTVYAFIAGGKKAVRSFYKNIFSSVLTSFATSSSLASLPTNMKTTINMGVDKDVAEVVLPIGSTMHMEGSSMAAILKIVFLFSVFNKPFTGFDTIIIAVLIAILSSVVMSGIPGGGLIGEALIVSLYGFPISAFMVIATIGWIIDPPATCINVCGDAVSTMLVSKLVNKKSI